MKYRDLIQFEPVEDVIQLKDANKKDLAEKLVSTYVISDRMANALIHNILPCLRMDDIRDNSGLFIVGNYGTGKSHLMSVISAVAEYPEMREKLTNEDVARALEPIAGKFKVLRQEAGTTEMSLRDVVFHYLQQALKEWGITYNFPDMQSAPNAKDLLVEMMGTFQNQYPNQGLLLILDELLDFLRHRKERELVSDLMFLREVGEICNQTRFRFIAGLQESLFDEGGKFQFAADSIRRVKDRFEQVRIVRDDVAFVVSRRLLTKTQAQRAQVRTHLEAFTPMYESMAERLEDFVGLFPVHPAYLEVFERVTVIEKRQVLKALSRAMRSLLDQDVPEMRPGLISFDAIWEMIKEDAAYRSVPEIHMVLEKSQVLEGRIQNALGVEAYKEPALRIINALAVHRLSVGGLRSSIGLTSKEIRDRLCLYLAVPEADAEFLLTSIEAVLEEILKTVSGQFISRNEENGQVYLDVDKDIDFDALIAAKAETLDGGVINRYFFDMIANSLELTDSAYVPGFRIWQRELPWPEHGVTRDGYIFLGAPNERSTAQPERDFYLHFLSLVHPDQPRSLDQADEIFFSIKETEDAFQEALQRYSGAKEMALTSTGTNKEEFQRKADANLRIMTRWMRENLSRTLEIRYQSETLSYAEVVRRNHLTVRGNSFRDQIFELASACLSSYFEQKYPHYPKFVNIQFTKETTPTAAQAALRLIAGRSANGQAKAVLEGLQLGAAAEGQWVFGTAQSSYAQSILRRLHALPAQQVLNRDQLLRGSLDVEKEIESGMEPEWLLVVLLTMVRQGEITLNLPGRRIDSDDLEDALNMGWTDLKRFTSISRPRSMPVQALQELFKKMDLPEGYIADASKHETAVQELQRALRRELEDLVQGQEWLREGLRYWHEPVLSSQEQQALKQSLDTYKAFLEPLQYLTAPGKLRSFAHSVQDVRIAMHGRQALQQLKQLKHALVALQASLEYIYEAEMQLPREHIWHTTAKSLQESQLAVLKDPQQRGATTLRRALTQQLTELKEKYIEAYLHLHNQARLNATLNQRKHRLAEDPHWTQLKGLRVLEFLPGQELVVFEEKLTRLRSCPGVGAADLQEQAICQQCGFSPRSEEIKHSAAQTLETLETDLERIYHQWTTALRSNLNSEAAQANLQLLRADDRQLIEPFLQSGELPERITQRFITGLQDALRGLEVVTIEASELLLALTRAGMPCTVEDFEQRFRGLLEEHLAGKNPAKVRIQIDW